MIRKNGSTIIEIHISFFYVIQQDEQNDGYKMYFLDPLNGKFIFYTSKNIIEIHFI